MPSYIHPRVFDNGLTILDTEADVLHLCSGFPSDYNDAVVTKSLGNKSGISISAPEDRSPSGRKVIVAAVEAGAPGTVTANGTANHYAIVDTANERLLAVAPISSAQVVASGNNFTTQAFEIGIAAPA